jgi:hypothetical protein
MNKKQITTLVGVFALAISSAAFAQTTPASATTSTAKAEETPEAVKNIRVRHATLLLGATLDKPLSSGSSAGNALYTDNYSSLGYNFKNAGYTLDFIARYAIQTVKERETRLEDFYVKAAKGSIVKLGTYNLYADARVYTPTSTKSQESNLIGRLGLKQVQTYDIPETKFTAALVTFERLSAYNNLPTSKAAGAENLLLVADADLAYNFSDALSANLTYEIVSSSKMSGQMFGGLSKPTSLLYPGATWTVTKWFNVNPYATFEFDEKSSLSLSNATWATWFNFTIQ